MIKVLIVDDDSTKIAIIEKSIYSSFNSNEINISIAKSLSDARELLSSNQYHMLILDMNIPNRYDSKEPKKDGGIAFLSHLQKNSKLKIPNHVMGLTAYAELIEEHENEFNDMGWLLIKFDRTTNHWEGVINNKLYHIIKSDSQKQESLPMINIFKIFGFVTILLIIISFFVKITLTCIFFIIMVAAVIIIAVLYSNGNISEKSFISFFNKLIKKDL
ncbi:MAG: hypothetical protein ACIAQZ_12450 [Sedimentisphaeraceae bacterium JB056]